MKRYVVIIREYERGWGSKDFVAKEHGCKEDALEYMNKINSENTAPTAPDYYHQARYVETMGEIEYEDINR